MRQSLVLVICVTSTFTYIFNYIFTYTFTYIFNYDNNPPTRTAFSQFPLLPTAGVSVSW